jgi:uncharacterized protein (TIGR03435 family)
LSRPRSIELASLATGLVECNQIGFPEYKRYNSMKISCLLLMAFAALFLAAPCSLGQESVFEVASVKPSQSARESSSIHNEPGGRFEATNTTLAVLIQYALATQAYQVVGGPGWIRDVRFDIQATAGQSDSGVKNAERFARIRGRIRRLLEDRFQLQLREEQREMPVYGLEVEKGGARMKPAEPLGNVNMNGGAAGSTLSGKGMTMPRLAEVLSGIASRPVYDETGLSGAYDLELKYSPDMAAPGAGAEAKDSSYPSLFTALKEQLGLRLTGKKGTAPVWVVVRAERPGEN